MEHESAVLLLFAVLQETFWLDGLLLGFPYLEETSKILVFNKCHNSRQKLDIRYLNIKPTLKDAVKHRHTFYVSRMATGSALLFFLLVRSAEIHYGCFGSRFPVFKVSLCH